MRDTGSGPAPRRGEAPLLEAGEAGPLLLEPGGEGAPSAPCRDRRRRHLARRVRGRRPTQEPGRRERPRGGEPHRRRDRATSRQGAREAEEVGATATTTSTPAATSTAASCRRRSSSTGIFADSTRGSAPGGPRHRLNVGYKTTAAGEEAPCCVQRQTVSRARAERS